MAETPTAVTPDDRFTVTLGPMTVTRISDGKVFFADKGREWTGLDYGDMTALESAIIKGLAGAIVPLGIEEAKARGKWTAVHEKAVGSGK